MRRLMMAGAGASDPYWGSVVAMLPLTGANGSTSFLDAKGKTWTANGGAQISTAQSMFGGGAMLVDGDGDYVATPAHADFGFGSGDWTVEGFYRRAASLNNAFLADFRVAAGNSFVIWCSQGSNTNKLCYSNEAGTGFVAGSIEFPLNAFVHWAMAKSGTTVRGFVGGASALTAAESRTLATPQGVYLGSSVSPVQGANGYHSYIRITKGVARYTAPFTPPSGPFPTS